MQSRIATFDPRVWYISPVYIPLHIWRGHWWSAISGILYGSNISIPDSPRLFTDVGQSSIVKGRGIPFGKVLLCYSMGEVSEGIRSLRRVRYRLTKWAWDIRLNTSSHCEVTCEKRREFSVWRQKISIDVKLDNGKNSTIAKRGSGSFRKMVYNGPCHTCVNSLFEYLTSSFKFDTYLTPESVTHLYINLMNRIDSTVFHTLESPYTLISILSIC